MLAASVIRAEDRLDRGADYVVQKVLMLALCRSPAVLHLVHLSLSSRVDVGLLIQPSLTS